MRKKRNIRGGFWFIDEKQNIVSAPVITQDAWKRSAEYLYQNVS